MQKKQKVSIWLAVVLVATASLRPPWLQVSYSLDEDLRNRLAESVKKMEDDGEPEQRIRAVVNGFRERYGQPHTFRWLFDPPVTAGKAGRVDLPRLFVEWVIAVAISAGLYFAWPTATPALTRAARRYVRVARALLDLLGRLLLAGLVSAMGILLLGVALDSLWSKNWVNLLLTVMVVGIVWLAIKKARTSNSD